MRVLVATLILCIPFSNGRLLAQSLFNFGGSYHAGSNPHAVAVADLNNDGNPDLIIPNYYSDNVTIMLGNGKGGFTEPTGSPFASRTPMSVAVGDFDGDSRPDVAIGNFGSPFPLGNGNIEVTGTISLFLGMGNGTFTPAPGNPFRLFGLGPSAAIARDLNGDGKLDLVATTSFRINVLFGDGSGGFSPAPQATPGPTGTELSSLAMADFDGDGKLDVAVSDVSRGQITIGFGNGAGAFLQTFNPLMRFDLGRFAVGIAVGDFNSDGRPDLVAAYGGGGSGTVLMWPAGSGGQFTMPTFLHSFQGYATSIATGDFNNDGKLDWVAANGGRNNVIVMLGDGAGGFSAASGSPYAVGTLPAAVAAGDFNNDGKLDIITANGNDVTILLNSAQPVLQFSTKNSASYASSAVFAPDMIAFGEAPGIAPALVVAPDGAWPTSLGGVKLEITDSHGQNRLAPLYYVTANAISYLVPAGTALGPASVKLTTSAGAIVSGTLEVGKVSPGLYTANAGATGVAAGFWIRVAANGTQSSGLLFDPSKLVGSRDAVPVDLGAPGDQIFLSLYGTGFRNATRATATFAGFSVSVYGFGAVGLYQGEDVINIGPVPRSVAGYGAESLLTITFDDNPANTITAFVH